jgi:phosphopentomutase
MRALLIVLDSVGVGAAPDAGIFGDNGADTMGHLLERLPGLRIPNLMELGLGEIMSRASCATPGHARNSCFGRMREMSAGKDTTTGHWEIAGVLLEEPFVVYERFPDPLVEAISEEAGVTFLGNYARSGTVILGELGSLHQRTGRPILYTSADSVMQIAAHEEVMARRRLYDICRIARRHCDEWGIGRVIARPFTGEPGNFQRTTGRHDFSIIPPFTVLNAISEIGHVVTGVGRIRDIFAGSGIVQFHPIATNREGMSVIEYVWPEMQDGLIFASLFEFDGRGHRRDPLGYGKCLEEFDEWLGLFLDNVYPDDLLIITADHGNDPTFPGTDHTREEVPLLVKYDNIAGNLGTRESFRDVAATLARFFQLPPCTIHGNPFLDFPQEDARPYAHRA